LPSTASTVLRPLLPVLLLLAVAASHGQPLAPIENLGFEVLDRVPQPRENFVQGLQLEDGRLYVGTGLYGESRLLIYRFPSMELQQSVALPQDLFGEGLTRFGDRLYQLTWRSGKLLVYDAVSLERIRTHNIGTQGWGITHDGEQLIYSDGSDRLRFLDADSLEVRRKLTVTLNGRPLQRLNELEYINGAIWANVWQANQLVRIDPASGAVTAIADLRGILDPRDRRPDTDVLNGIAWDGEADTLWVTGKRWPWIFRIRLIPKAPVS
jgi:glutamine cyclotransferase